MKIFDAVILMAGTGSRLRGSAATIAKPLIPIAGRPLISYAIESFDKAGVETIHAVVGPNGDELAAAVAPLLPSHLELRPIANPNWQKQNGVSVLTAEGKVRTPFFLAMGDHLFERSILDKLLGAADPTRLNLAIDRKISSIFEYLRRVLTDGDCSLADGVRLMAEEGNAQAIDIGDAWWQDVDTPQMLARAEEEVTRLL